MKHRLPVACPKQEGCNGQQQAYSEARKVMLVPVGHWIVVQVFQPVFFVCHRCVEAFGCYAVVWPVALAVVVLSALSVVWAGVAAVVWAVAVVLLCPAVELSVLRFPEEPVGWQAGPVFSSFCYGK